MNRREFIGQAALCAAAGLWIGASFAAAVNGTAPANLDALRRVAAAERYEITQLKSEIDHVFVEYVLRPTTSSYIRCQLAMPASAAKWDGRLWGIGNGGPGGRVNVDVGVAKRGSAAVHTDMGTSKGVYGNREALIDFGWRSTHLMTVSAKKFVTAFFGRAPSKCYFKGGSTGGGQGFHEALRFPDDYDGILSYVPANTRMPLHVYFAWNQRLLCDRYGKRVFSKEELSAVETAAIDYFADKDKPFARGRFLSDSRYTPEAEKGILELAKKKCPSLTDGDKLERLHKMFTGPVLNGWRVHAGIPFSAAFEPAASNQWMLRWYLGPNRALHNVTDDELAAWLRDWSPICDACGAGFADFAKRGGKMIVIGGLEDSVVPYPSMIDWYERATEELGGRAKLEDACRLYLLPGRAHGRGRGCGSILNDQKLLTDWVEKGKRPEDVTSDLKSGEKLTIHPYPACFARSPCPIGVETPKEITVLTWNTEHYGFERKSPALRKELEKNMFELIRAANPDIFLIQETYGSFERFKAAFPEYHAVLQSESSSMFSRFPIAGTRRIWVDKMAKKPLAFNAPTLNFSEVVAGDLHLRLSSFGMFWLPLCIRLPAELSSEGLLKWEAAAQPYPFTPRPQAIKERIAAMKPMLDEKDRIPLVLGGDFNSLSHLDWTAANGGAPEHRGRVVPWPVSKALVAAGFTDAYRAVHPDEVKDPGVTHPMAGCDAQQLKPFNRLDYVYSAGSRIRPIAAEVICGDYHKPFAWRGRMFSMFPSDHAPVLVRFEVATNAP